jgi:hypothetical protein
MVLTLLPVAAFADDFILSDESAYKVLNEITSTYKVRGSTFLVKYIVLENVTEINELESKEYDLNFSIERAVFEGKKLENENRDMGKLEEKYVATLSELETQRNATREFLSVIESKKARLEGMLNSAMLISPVSYNAGVAVFIIILILTITMKSRQMLLRNQINLKRKTIQKEGAK